MGIYIQGVENFLSSRLSNIPEMSELKKVYSFSPFLLMMATVFFLFIGFTGSFLRSFPISFTSVAIIAIASLTVDFLFVVFISLLFVFMLVICWETLTVVTGNT